MKRSENQYTIIIITLLIVATCLIILMAYAKMNRPEIIIEHYNANKKELDRWEKTRSIQKEYEERTWAHYNAKQRKK